MFSIRWRPRSEPRPSPDPLEWWERSVRDRELGAQIVRLQRALEFSMACAEHGDRPAFLRALGRDLEIELEQLVTRAKSGATGSVDELAIRSEILEELVDYYGDLVMPWTKSPTATELSDCVREAVAGLSREVSLVMRIEAEPVVILPRRRVTALCELAIRAATARPEDEVQVTLAARPDVAVIDVVWRKAEIPPQTLRDSARCLALAVAYAGRLGGTLRHLHDQVDTVRISLPSNRRPAS